MELLHIREKKENIRLKKEKECRKRGSLKSFGQEKKTDNFDSFNFRNSFSLFTHDFSLHFFVYPRQTDFLSLHTFPRFLVLPTVPPLSVANRQSHKSRHKVNKGTVCSWSGKVKEENYFVFFKEKIHLLEKRFLSLSWWFSKLISCL